VRGFLDHCLKGPGCIGNVDSSGLNPAYLDNIAEKRAAARRTGPVILFTSNALQVHGGHAEEPNAQAGALFSG